MIWISISIIVVLLGVIIVLSLRKPPIRVYEPEVGMACIIHQAWCIRKNWYVSVSDMKHPSPQLRILGCKFAYRGNGLYWAVKDRGEILLEIGSAGIVVPKLEPDDYLVFAFTQRFSSHVLVSTMLISAPSGFKWCDVTDPLLRPPPFTPSVLKVRDNEDDCVNAIWQSAHPIPLFT
jgi:hypothetical protein